MSFENEVNVWQRTHCQIETTTRRSHRPRSDCDSDDCCDSRDLLVPTAAAAAARHKACRPFSNTFSVFIRKVLVRFGVVFGLFDDAVNVVVVRSSMAHVEVHAKAPPAALFNNTCKQRHSKACATE